MSGDTLKVEFELSESDLAFFKERLDKARDNRADDEQMIIEGIAAMKKEAIAANPPKFENLPPNASPKFPAYM